MLYAQHEPPRSTADLAREVAVAEYGHGLDAETGRCDCGGAWVRFPRAETYGCDLAGPPPPPLAFDARGRVTRWADGCIVFQR